MFPVGIKLPSSIKSGTFYHAGTTLSARMSYKLQAKLEIGLLKDRASKNE